MLSATARDFQRARLRICSEPANRQHKRWNHSDSRAVTIPIHGGREIGPPLFYKILRQLGIALDEFGKLR
jgi:hypothetical protein